MSDTRSRVRSLMLFSMVVIMSSGCQTYKQQTAKMTAEWRQGNVGEAVKLFSARAEKQKNTKDTVIWRLEQGAVLRAAGMYEESNKAFDVAEEKIDRHEEQAKISVGRETAALLSNQANLPYEGRDYDKVLLNTYQALNYLQLGQPEKARTELIRAYQRQQDAVENNKRRIEKTEEAANKLKESKEKGADQAKEMADKAKSDEKFNQQLQAAYQHLEGLKAYADYVNPFPVYLDAIYFMTAGTGGSDLERARVSFERTLGLTGDNKFIRQDLETIEKVLQGSAVPPTTYVIFETGSAPARDQIRIDLPLFLVGARNVPYVGAAFPTIQFQEGHLPNLHVTANGTTEATVTLASMDSVVGQAFKNEMPVIVTKTLISTAAKAAAAYAVNKGVEREDFWVQLIVKVGTSVAQAAVNIADTRTWTTLPKEYQFCRIPTPPDGRLELSGPNGEAKIQATVQSGAVNLVCVRSISATNPLLVSQAQLKPPAIVAVNAASTTAAEIREQPTVPTLSKAIVESGAVSSAALVERAPQIIPVSNQPERKSNPEVAIAPSHVLEPARAAQATEISKPVLTPPSAAPVKTKAQRLAELNALYFDGKIAPPDYHEARAKIVGER